MKRILPYIFSIWAIASFSQGEMTLPMMEHVYQSSYINPAAVPDHKVSIGLPASSIKLSYINTGFLLLNGFDKENGKSVFNVDKLIDAMPSNNYLHFGTQVDVFHLRVKWRNSFVSFDAGNTTEFNSIIPKSFFQLATLQWSDPGTETGRTFDLSSFNAKALSYNHYSFGLNKMFRHFNIGGRINLLQGIASTVVTSDNSKIGISTDEIALNGSLTSYTSGINSSDKANLATQFSNLGASVDLGITYKYRERLFLGLAANNIGFIDWKNDIDNSKYYQSQEKGPFKGVDAFGPIVRGDSLNNIHFADTVKNYFSGGSDSSVKKNAYRTWLTPRIYLSANYKITDKFSVSAMVKFEQYIDWRYALMAGAQYKVGRFFSLTGSAIYQYDKLTFGAGVVIKPGPFQLYIVSDNIATLYRLDKFAGENVHITAPFDSKMLNIRFGMNLVFGRILDPRKQAFNYK